jgi:multiple sugar transport system permease protein
MNLKTLFLLTSFLPLFGLLLVFRVVPIAKLAISSLQDSFLAAIGESPWIWLQNYRELFSDPLFYQSALRSLAYTLFFLVFVFIGSFIIGLSLSKMSGRFGNISLILFLSPLMTNVAAAGVLFAFLFQPKFGLLNYLLSLLHISGPGWLFDPNTALISVVIMDSWRTVGFYATLFMTGILNLPQEIIEAAEVDGARLVRKYWNIILPLLKPTILLVLTMCTINALKAFEPIFVMTNTSFSDAGGPVNSTHVISIMIYNAAFRFSRIGYASSISMIFLVISGIFIYFQIRSMRIKWQY